MTDATPIFFLSPSSLSFSFEFHENFAVVYLPDSAGGIPAALGNVRTLEEIDLSATQLRGEIPKELGQLAMLSTLALGSCGLTGE